MRRILVAILGLGLLAAACYRADDNGGRCDPGDDSVYVESLRDIEDGLWCFDDGDGYPTLYPPIVGEYPTTGGT